MQLPETHVGSLCRAHAGEEGEGSAYLQALAHFLEENYKKMSLTEMYREVIRFVSSKEQVDLTPCKVWLEKESTGVLTSTPHCFEQAWIQDFGQGPSGVLTPVGP